jgi:hypothetical protein
MLVQVCSDYHFEFSRGRLSSVLNKIRKSPEVEIGICAGDLTVLSLPFSEVLSHFDAVANRYKHLIYVPGNHEYYGVGILKGMDILEEIEDKIKNLHILRIDKPLELEGLRFLGDTMWFPQVAGVQNALNHMSDYYQIKDLVPYCFDHSNAFMDYLKNTCKSTDIIVTHHLPSIKSTPSQFLNTSTQPCFVNIEAERLLDSKSVSPAAWIHGHSHGRTEYTLDGTHVICNPVGYPSENPRDLGDAIWEF